MTLQLNALQDARWKKCITSHIILFMGKYRFLRSTVFNIKIVPTDSVLSAQSNRILRFLTMFCKAVAIAQSVFSSKSSVLLVYINYFIKHSITKMPTNFMNQTNDFLKSACMNESITLIRVEVKFKILQISKKSNVISYSHLYE